MTAGKENETNQDNIPLGIANLGVIIGRSAAYRQADNDNHTERTDLELSQVPIDPPSKRIVHLPSSAHGPRRQITQLFSITRD
jgi:hypothetical protein